MLQVIFRKDGCLRDGFVIPAELQSGDGMASVMDIQGHRYKVPHVDIEVVS